MLLSVSVLAFLEYHFVSPSFPFLIVSTYREKVVPYYIFFLCKMVPR